MKNQDPHGLHGNLKGVCADKHEYNKKSPRQLVGTFLSAVVFVSLHKLYWDKNNCHLGIDKSVCCDGQNLTM